MAIADTPRFYVIVRKDLPPAAVPVQALHAAINLTVHLSPDTYEWGFYGPSLVLLEVENEERLRAFVNDSLAEYAGEGRIEPFYEPTFNHSMTAAAYYGLRLPTMKGFNLLRP